MVQNEFWQRMSQSQIRTLKPLYLITAWLPVLSGSPFFPNAEVRLPFAADQSQNPECRPN